MQKSKLILKFSQENAAPRLMAEKDDLLSNGDDVLQREEEEGVLGGENFVRERV